MVASSSGAGGAGQGVVGRHGEDEALTAEGQEFNVFRHRRFGDHAEGQIGLPGGQGFQGPRQDPVAQAQACRRFEGEKGFAQFEHGCPVDHAIHGQGEFRFPACGNTLHPVGHRVQLAQQARSLPQQFRPCRCQPGVARTAVKQQHIQCILDLPDPVGEGAGHHPCRPGCCGEAARLGNALEHGEGIGGEHIPG
jgi:hypothetical protein